jgi:hypothetical protein
MITHGKSKHGSSPNDKGAQAGSGPKKASDEALQSGMTKRAESFGKDGMKEQGYVNVKGTM